MINDLDVLMTSRVLLVIFFLTLTYLKTEDLWKSRFIGSTNGAISISNH